jgi:hypothetical protein
MQKWTNYFGQCEAHLDVQQEKGKDHYVVAATNEDAAVPASDGISEPENRKRSLELSHPGKRL